MHGGGNLKRSQTLPSAGDSPKRPAHQLGAPLRGALASDFLPLEVSHFAIGATGHGWFPVLGWMMWVGGLPLFHLPPWGRWWL